MIADKGQAGGSDSDSFDSFNILVHAISARFHALAEPVFHTDAAGLYDAYLASFSAPTERQEHACSCCRQFIERFGALATVSDSGALISAIWDIENVPQRYRAACAALRRLVGQAAVTGPLLARDAVYGTLERGGWAHFAVAPDPTLHSAGLCNTFYAARVRREEYDAVRRALAEYTEATCATALRLLKADSLANSEAALGQAQFLVDLHAARESVSGQQRKDNLVYRMVALASPGFCHPRCSIIATLLDDLAAGKSVEHAATNWAARAAA